MSLNMDYSDTINNNNSTNFEEETISLYETSRERETLDEQANLYSIIVATEHLERAYARDWIDPQMYSTQCKKLLSQFKLAERVLKNVMTTEEFMKQYQLDCPRAHERLLVMGVPEPMKNSSDTLANHAVTVAEVVEHFITTMDAVRLEQRAVDELQPCVHSLFVNVDKSECDYCVHILIRPFLPYALHYSLLSDLMNVLAQVPDTPSDFEPKQKVETWLCKLNAMRAVDEITAEDSRQLFHDLDSAYSCFTRYLKSSRE
jgi:ESCRT-I complex subunit VPS28